MSCYLYKVGFAETALIFSAATSVGASLIQSWFGGEMQVSFWRNIPQLGQAPGWHLLFSAVPMA